MDPMPEAYARILTGQRNPLRVIEGPDLSVTPLAYTEAEGHKFQLWDNPGHFNAILWEDGRRWDCLNGYTRGFDKQTIADLKEILMGGMWFCKAHSRKTDYVHNGRRSCPPDVDDDTSKCDCVKEE